MLFFLSCSIDKKLQQTEQLIKQTKSEFIEDGRTEWYAISAKANNNKKLVLEGSTINKDAYGALMNALQEAKIDAIDEVKLLPNSALDKQTYGLVNISVANMRSYPKHSSQLVTQALMGMTLRVWDVQGDWYLVQSPDDYFGWMDAGGLVLVDNQEYEAYNLATKVMFTESFGFAYAKPDASSQKVCDLVRGCVLPIAGGDGDYAMVALPDGRIGYLPQGDYENLEAIQVSTPTRQDIIDTAMEYLGRPYLWGGTSDKGIDCSGYTKTVYYRHGIKLPRDASQQVLVGEPIIDDIKDVDQLLPGDLLYFGTIKNNKEKVTHVAIYLGNCEVIHATGSVKIESLCPNGKNYAEARRLSFLRGKRVL